MKSKFATKAVIFDFDGVIFDTLDRVWSVVREVFLKHGVPVRTKQEFLDMFEENWYDSLKKIEKSKEKFNSVIEECRQRLKVEQRSLDIFKGIDEVIRKLKKKHKLGLISSNFDEVIKQNLEEHDLLGYFDHYLGADVEQSKVKKMKSCLEMCNVNAADAVFICDTLGDIKEGKKLGIKVIAVTWGFHSRERLLKGKPDFVAEKPEQLLEILG